MNFTVDDIDKMIEARQTALDANQSTFIYRGAAFDVDYAYYLIHYLKDQFNV